MLVGKLLLPLVVCAVSASRAAGADVDTSWPGPGAAVTDTDVTPLAEPPTETSPRARGGRSRSHHGYSDARKDPRFLNVFQLVRFPNAECVSAVDGVNGTCYSAAECSALGGRASGQCAQNYGVCCLFSAGCGETISRNNTVFRGPGNLTAPFNCRVTINKLNNNICQLRLDMQRLRLAAPDENGVCRQDQFTVIGAASGQPPVLCNDNDGQFMYVDVTPGAGSQVTLQVTTSVAGTDSSTVNRDFDIKVSQIECNSPSRAPAGCLQYFTNVTGQIKSFGFDSGPPHLANQRYSICIRTNAGFCGVQYTAGMATNNFTVSEDLGAVKGASCLTDYLQIVGISPDGITGTAEDRHCGTVWAGDTSGTTPGVTFSRPFVVFVRFDGTETSVEQEGNNRGFLLDYTQVPCTSVTSGTGAFSGPLIQRPPQSQPQLQPPQLPQLPRPQTLPQQLPPGTVISSGIIGISDPSDNSIYVQSSSTSGGYPGYGPTNKRPYRPSPFEARAVTEEKKGEGQRKVRGWNQRSSSFYFG